MELGGYGQLSAVDFFSATNWVNTTRMPPSITTAGCATG
jgi:hypothetical protein